MKHPHPRPLSKSVCSVVTSGLLLLGFGMDRVWGAATNDVWTGGGTPDGNWQNANNWGGIAPVALDSLYFDGAVQTQVTNNFPAGTIFGNIGFNSSADVFTLYGNGVVLHAFTNGIDSSTINPVSGNITNNSFNVETVNIPLTLSAGRHVFATVGGGQLNLNGAVTRNLGGTVVFSPLAGNINVAGSFDTNGFNNIIGGWATLGGDWATIDATSNVVAYTGYVDIGAGVVANDPTSNVRYIGDSANITAASGTRINTLLTQQGVARSLTVTNLLKLGPKGGIYRLGNGVMTVTGGTITADGGGEITFYDTPFNATGGNNLNIVSAISNDGPNAVTVNIMGYVQYGQAAGVFNNYSGGTYINQGRVQITPLAGFGTGPVYVFPSGQILFNSNGTFTNNFFIGGVGTAESGGLGAFRMGGAGRIVSGRVTLMGDATIANNGRISGQITGDGILSIGHGSSANGHGVIQVGGAIANDYTGDTIINGTASQAADTLQIFTGFNNIMPHGAGKGNVILNAGSATASATFDLNGTTQIINGLANTTTSPANDFVTSSAAGGLLMVGDNNATTTFGGRIQSSVGLTKIGAGTLALTGVNTYTNATTVNGGTLSIASGSLSAATPVLAVNSNATLDVVALCPLTLGAAQSLSMSNGIVVVVPQGSGNGITTPTLTAGGNTNRIGVTSIPAIAAYPAQFTLIKYTTLNGALNFGLSGSLPPSPGLPYAGFISNNVANNSVDLVITAGPASVRWVGYSSGSPNSAWDIGGTANWRTLGGAPTTYSDGSFALFDDTASNGVVTLSQSVAPAGITVTNSALNYTINDFSGSFISGNGSLAKLGNGTLILDNIGVNTFSGGVTISGGTLQVGNADTGGNLPASGTIANNGALVFARVDEITVANSIAGSGTITQNGLNGGLTLSGNNTFTGAVTVAQGSLRLGNNSALGTTNGGTVINSGATLDIVANTINIGQEPVSASGTGVGGSGAIVNNSGLAAFSTANIARLTLTGPTTIGGSGRWDLRSSATGNPLLASLNVTGPHKLTKVGGNQISIVGVTVDPNLGDIDVQAGTFGVEAATTGLGNSASNLTVAAGATFHMFAPTNQLNKVFTIHDGSTVDITSGAGTIIGPMTLTNSSLSAAPYCTFNIGGTSLTLNNVLTGDAILYKQTGTSPLTLSGNSPNFAGGILLNIGNLTISGTLSNSLGVSMSSGTRLILTGALLGNGLTNGFNSTLIASGSSAGLVDIQGNLLPGDAGVAGTFTAGGLILEGSANLTNDLDFATTPGGGTNDLIVVNGDLVMNGGTININPLGLLQVGVPYRLFNYTGNLVTNVLPTIPNNINYTFTLDFSTTNQVKVIATGGPPVWNGGSSTANNWSDPANWNGTTIVPGDNLYFAGNNRINNTNDTAATTGYSDLVFVSGAGAFVLNGNPITLGGNVVNSSTNAATVKIGLSFTGTRTFNGSAGPLFIGGGVTNAANGTTLTLAGSGTLTNLLDASDPNSMTNIISVVSNANWTLADNASSAPITTPVQFDVLGGTFNFGQGASAPNLSSTANANNSRVGVTPFAPATFNMNGGTLTLTARLNTGAAGNSISTVNQTGGTLNVQLFQNADGSAAASCAVNLTGGTLNVGVPTRTTFFVSSRGTGVVTVATSGVLNCGTLDVSRGISSSTPSTVNLNTGGLISATRVGTASSASVGTSVSNTATFNFNGGTLQAAASSTTYFQGNTASPAIPIIAIVKSGGAVIDTTNFNITVLEPLIHDSTLGATLDGGLIKKGSGRLTLSSVSTYTGMTIVTNGNLAINGSVGLTTVIVATNGTLSGTGTCGSNVIVQLGGTVAPGTTVGTLTANSAVNLQGTALMDVQKTGTATNDRLRSVTGAINYGGTLVVTNVGGVLVGGESFKLFDSGINSYTGAFSLMQLAPLGAGLSWNTTQLNVSGTISVSGTLIPPSVTSVVASGSNLVSSGNNGIPLGQYAVLSTTNLLQPLSSWTRIQTNSFDGSGNFTFTNAIDPAGRGQFFRVLVLP